MPPPEKLVDYTEFHANQDLEYLRNGIRLAAIFLVLMSSFPLSAALLFAVGIVVAAVDDSEGYSGIAPSSVIVVACLIATLFVLCLAVSTWLLGTYLKERRNHAFCRVAALALTVAFPFGTFYGLVTYFTLGRGAVRELFERGEGPLEDPWEYF